MAIYGPFVKTITSNAIRFQSRKWYRQTPPYLERLPYEMTLRRVLSGDDNATGASYVALDSSPCYQEALNKAYERFRNAVHEKAELAVSIAERKQAMEMIVKRLSQLTSFTRSLRKGDLNGALKALGYQRPKQTRKVTNAEKQKRWDQYRRRARKSYAPVSDTYNEAFDGFSSPPRSAGRAFRKKQTKTWRQRGEVASDLWLEFHFGWVPLVKDIGAAIDVLQKPFNPVAAKGRGKATATSGSKPSPLSYGVSDTHKWTSRVQLIAEVHVSNPNLYLANQLGLVNPAIVVWELVPFSFVVDWFTNVSSFLSQCTEFMGLELKRSATTHMVTDEKFGWYGNRDVSQLYHSIEDSWRRSTGISKPSLQFKPLKAWSETRGATVIALLLQQLKGVK